MSRFYFFTDIDSVGSQAAADAFGPVIGSPDSQFRVTSIHRAVAGKTPNAYAVCAGQLMVQEAGNNLVNLILRPTEQPPFSFPEVKFFIYRRVKRTSLIDGNEVAPATNNDLTKSIWESQQKRNASQGTSDNPLAGALGVDITGNGSIDEAFFRENVSYQLPAIGAGWSLGTFDPAHFGFEIMVHAIGFDPNLPMVRTAENVVVVPELSGQTTQAQEFKYWHDKEAILNYIDPCAFFGCFYSRKLKIKHADGSVSKKKQNEIYDDVLKGAHLTSATDGVFFNRKTTYLDIRNEYNHSLNYFKNYGTTYSTTDLKCAFKQGGGLNARNYYDNTWPLMIIKNSELSANNNSRKNIIRLALPSGAGDNPYPTLYVSAGFLNDLFPREPKEKAKLIDLNLSSGFTDEVVLAIPNHSSQGSTRAISSYIKLKYFKRIGPHSITPPVSSGTVIRAGSFLDNLFAPLDMKAPFAGPGKIKSHIYDAEVFVDMTLAGGYDFVGSVGILDDGINYTFILNPKIVRTPNNKKSSVVPLSGEKSSATDVWSLLASKLKRKKVQKSTLEFSDPTNNVDYLEIVDEEGDLSVTHDEPLWGYQSFTIRKADLLAIDTSVFTAWSPIYMSANNLVRYADKLGQEYWNFDISLNGYWLNGNDVEVKEVVSNITLYVNGDFGKGSDIKIGIQNGIAESTLFPTVSAVPPIKHVFVLMLENRSFDHMLGFSQISGTDAITGNDTTINGVDETYFNINSELGPFDPLKICFAKTPADFQVIESDFGPPHEFMDALLQLCSDDASSYQPAQGIYPQPGNGGFVDSCRLGLQESEPIGGEGSPQPEASPHPEKVMNCFDPAQLPVLTKLAREYAVCDNWYSSLPGPTWPNRFFVHAATSGGLATSPTNPVIGKSYTVRGFGFKNGHIFDRLENRGLEWRVYEGNEFPQVFSLQGMNHSALVGHFVNMPFFLPHLMNPSFLPTYTFIEPHHGNLTSNFGSQFLNGDSQHPCDDVRPGEILIKHVYETIRNSPHWNNSVLIITYDEHGGFYDHVPPPETTPTGDDKKYLSTISTQASAAINKFNFARLGARVPTVIISPLIPKGTIDHTLYDHSSILATLEKMFRLEPLTKRDKNANDFRHLFSLTSPRVSAAEAPLALPDPPASFPNAAGEETFRNIYPDITPPMMTPPGGGTPINAPLHPPRKKYLEEDLKLLLDSDPTLHLPTMLAGAPSPDFLAWLHVAFRRDLALHPETDFAARELILREYCSLQTVADAEIYIEKVRTNVQIFRGLPPIPIED